MTSALLHILAMALMLIDHLWATIVPGNEWMSCVGRLAFPIFAFMIAEGYRRTSDVKQYAKRLFLFALISEIPFNLMVASSPIYPFHQNVLWTFLLSVGCMALLDRAGEKLGKVWFYPAAAGVCVAGFIAGYLLFADYYGVGVLTVLVFYFFPKRNIWHFLAQFVCLWMLHVEVLGGFTYLVQLGSFQFGIVQQGLALFALIPIWLYRGEQGYHAPWFKRLCYWFYPAHMAALYLIGQLLYWNLY